MSRCLQKCVLLFLLLMLVTAAEAQLKLVAPRAVTLQNKQFPAEIKQFPAANSFPQK
jgi:hypothetical protein